jgi:hypothetical protein
MRTDRASSARATITGAALANRRRKSIPRFYQQRDSRSSVAFAVEVYFGMATTRAAGDHGATSGQPKGKQGDFCVFFFDKLVHTKSPSW